MTAAHLDTATKQGHAAIFVRQAESALRPWLSRQGHTIIEYYLAEWAKYLADGDTNRATQNLAEAVESVESVLIHERTVKQQRKALTRAHRSLVRALVIYEYA